ncbi:hypothetical protein BJ684DRAFT_18262 [Piptocephalis cylindrospora]|uniref:tRNA-splicing endonuclease subunit Sen54 N-terminal domain-containing protein n=1 Tax=Piptocephalis cylindrospora TaxID=1907219 RepID=A0A4P9Y8I3_9FUNG|nr:hypothetical protein BJ684DRAFT_18262 [Piptocephalis cylindrospora]|eukprot:RKP15408.1 hypothetical protein BJ684DRAFT_18262 [Piptocephalis cylindrospora]
MDDNPLRQQEEAADPDTRSTVRETQAQRKLKELDAQIHAQLSAPHKPISKKQQSTGEWVEDRGMVRVCSTKGSYLQTMGVTEKGQVYLQPEEVMVLQERGLLQLSGMKGGSHRGESTSGPSYHLLLSSGLSLAYFQVYGLLRRLGFVVYRQSQLLSGRRASKKKDQSDQMASFRVKETAGLFGYLGKMTRRGIWLLSRPLCILFTWMVPATLGPSLHVWKPKGTFSKRDPGPPSFSLSIHSTISYVTGVS